MCIVVFNLKIDTQETLLTDSDSFGGLTALDGGRRDGLGLDHRRVADLDHDLPLPRLPGAALLV